MCTFGVQEWLMRAEGRARHRPRGSSVGVVNVCELIKTRAIRPWTTGRFSFVPEYDWAAWLMRSMVSHVVKPSAFFVFWSRN